MPCIFEFEGCSVPDDDQDELVLECSSDPAHTAHLSCWAAYAADNFPPDREAWCPATIAESCTGLATHSDYDDPEELRLLIASSIQAQGLPYRLPPTAGNVPDPEIPDIDSLLDDLDTIESVEWRPQCTTCLEDLPVDLATADYAPGAFWCSGRARDRERAVYCTKCAEAAGRCRICNAFTLAPASKLAAPVPQEVVHQFAHEIAGCRGRGRKQVGMLCYAAAASTAMLWGAKKDYSVYECMHFYLVSDQAAADDTAVAWYRDAHEKIILAKEFADYTLRQILENVFLTAPDYSDLMSTVVWKFGSPVFPQEVPAILHQGMRTDQLVTAITRGRAVIKGEGSHWTVVFGVRGESEQNITSICVYDPMGDTYEIESWDPGTQADYYVVG